MSNIAPEKDIRFSTDGEAQHMERRRGSIYQVIPPGERRMSAQGRRISIVDDIFGEIKEGGPNYRNVILPKSSLFVEVHADWLTRSDGLELPC